MNPVRDLSSLTTVHIQQPNLELPHEYRQQFRRDGNHYYKKLYLEDLPLLNDLTLNKDYIFLDKESNKEYIDLRNTKEDVIMITITSKLLSVFMFISYA